MQNLRVLRNTVAGNQSEGISISCMALIVHQKKTQHFLTLKSTYLLISLNREEKFSWLKKIFF